MKAAAPTTEYPPGTIGVRYPPNGIPSGKANAINSPDNLPKAAPILKTSRTKLLKELQLQNFKHTTDQE